jgi:hypothetical protein
LKHTARRGQLREFAALGPGSSGAASRIKKSLRDR